MPKFRRKKPIEAFRLTEWLKWEQLPDWAFGDVIVHWDWKGPGAVPTHATIRKPGRTVRVDLGDYIIRDIGGEVYSCKSDIFEKTYEPVDEENGRRRKRR